MPDPRPTHVKDAGLADGPSRQIFHTRPDGTDYPNRNEFVAIEPPARLVVRHPSPTHGFLLTITLRDDAGGTRIGWQQLFDDARECERMRPVCVPANEQNLDRLAAELAAHP